MATAVEISRQDMHKFLAAQGFKEIQNLPGTKEIVYGKIVDKTSQLCLRVYTSVVGETSRGTGEDAIRCVLVTKVGQDVKVIGGDRRVHRVEGWRSNLQNRLDNWAEQLGPACPKCQAATVRRRSKRGPFWGCCRYPVCKSVQPIQAPVYSRNRPAAGERGGEHEEAVLARREHFEDEFDQRRAEDRDLERHIAESEGDANRAWEERMQEKAEYARLEREMEARAYMDEVEAELRAAGVYDGDDEPVRAHRLPANDPVPANW